MKRMGQMAAVLVVAGAMTACGGGNANGDRAADPAGNKPDAKAVAPASGDAVGTTGMAGGDRDFIADQLEDGQAEVQLGRLAQERATNPQVKEFAAMMVTDHTKAGRELHQMMIAGASAGNDMKMEELNGDHKDLQEDLAKLNGRDFDRQYMDAMVKEHKEAVDELKDKADSASNQDVKQWAAKTLPVVQQHYEHAQQLQQSLQSTGGDRK